MKCIFCVPSLHGPSAPFLAALEKSIPLIIDAGWQEGAVEERGNPYISGARAIMTRKALDAGADVIVYLDYDLSWDPADLLALLNTEGDVVAGTYRFKQDEEKYMGALVDGPGNRPVVRADGCIRADRVPAGFLKITRDGLDRFMAAYPQLQFGPPSNPSIDLFNHGAIDRVWYGEDYAFSKRWCDAGGMIWIRPGLNIVHHTADKAFPGNFHEFLMRQPGGSKDPGRAEAQG